MDREHLNAEASVEKTKVAPPARIDKTLQWLDESSGVSGIPSRLFLTRQVRRRWYVLDMRQNSLFHSLRKTNLRRFKRLSWKGGLVPPFMALGPTG